MNTEKIIEDFFEEQFQNTSQIFLYKDKQLLKSGKFHEFADEQISKANKAFWSIVCGIFIWSLYGIMFLIEYGANPNWLDLILGLVSWMALIFVTLFSAKQYYTIRSSMSLFIRLLEKKEKESVTQTAV